MGKAYKGFFLYQKVMFRELRFLFL